MVRDYMSIIDGRYGKLTVLEKTNKKQRREFLYLCQCDCGNITYQTRQALTIGHVRSCGCLQKEQASMIYKHQVVDGTKPGIFTDKPNKNNKTGFRGVSTYQQSGTTKYKASLYFKGKNYTKKGFLTAEDARDHRLYLEKIYLKDIKNNPEPN